MQKTGEQVREKTYSVDALQKRVAQDVKRHVPAGLDAAIRHAVARVREAQVFLLQSELLAADGEAHDGELVDRGVGRVEVTLLGVVVFAARDGVVDGLAEVVVDEGERRARVRNGLVAGAGDVLASDDGRGALEHPEPLRVVHGRVVWSLAAQGRPVDVSEGVEGGALVRVVGVLDGAEVGGEELRGLGDVVLGDHVLDWGLDAGGGDGVDGTEGEAEEPVARVLLELSGEGFGQLDGLVFDDDAADVDDVCSNGARGRGTISVGDLPGRARGVFERAGLCGVEDGMFGAFGGGCRQLGGPKLRSCQRWVLGEGRREHGPYPEIG